MADALGKGGSAPSTPDYTGLAEKQAKLQAQNNRAALLANRPTQTNAYGTTSWTHTPKFDQGGYAAALDKYNKDQAAYRTNSAAPRYSAGYGDSQQGAGELMNPVGAAPVAPNQSDFMTGEDWAQNTTLNPTIQGIWDSYANLLKGDGATPGQGQTNLILSRIQPQMDQQRAQMDTQLRNQGLVPGTEAYNNAMRVIDQKQNDLLTAASIEGNKYGLSTLGSLQSLANPNFPQFASSTIDKAPDLLGSAQNTFNGQMAAYNADQAASGNLMSGLFSMGAAALGGPLGGAIGSAFSGVPGVIDGGYSSGIGSAYGGGRKGL